MKKAKSLPYSQPGPVPSQLLQWPGVPKPPWMNKAGQCVMCLQSQPWLSVAGCIICGACHVPAREGIVERYLTTEEIQTLTEGRMILWKLTASPA